MAGNGGKREGSGRPKGSVSETTRIALKLREKIAKAVEKRFAEIEQASFDLAIGHFVEVQDKLGQTRIYKESPDVNAVKYLLDQTVGKPKESIELNNPQENVQLAEINSKLEKMYHNVKAKRKD